MALSVSFPLPGVPDTTLDYWKLWSYTVNPNDKGTVAGVLVPYFDQAGRDADKGSFMREYARHIELPLDYDQEQIVDAAAPLPMIETVDGAKTPRDALQNTSLAKIVYELIKVYKNNDLLFAHATDV